MDINAYSYVELALITMTCIVVGFVVIGAYQARRDYLAAVQRAEKQDQSHPQMTAKASS